ncbi:hypothetical protein BCR43DRAFT_498546 [Syncephalastrum racemosum]|uniref:Needs CLA4 to survive protein 3 n=1 Tax=Syncephalastrum racemosum TaxID=13706 RepID=A0A1X2H117_SYNRA|nr:hypothetical protein BCR43DRAFT_498546 [Syncephalastrum racemosum]
MSSEDDLREENRRLRARIAELEARSDSFSAIQRLTNDEIRRFGRQLILPNFGVEGQLKLRNTSVLIVGAGGLGSPAALYLGAGGIGKLGIVDHDAVDISNLHRQVIHRETTQGINKAVSAALALQEIHPACHVVPYQLVLDSSNALDIVRQYDVVLDCTDNVATRYLLNDACVLAGKPLVSGSALRLDGQLTVYNYRGGPCYRCLHPVPPPPATVTNCSDGGVLGVVPGVIGVLQALEAIRIITDMCDNKPNMLLFSAGSAQMFRTVKLRGRKQDCVICGDSPSITQLVDYVEFCGASATDKDTSLNLLGPDDRIAVKDYERVANDASRSHLLLDVRSQVQYGICNLPGSLSIPLDCLEKQIPFIKQTMAEQNIQDVYVVCRMGNDSQLAVQMLEEHGIHGARDITGGLYQWATEVDKNFPIY